VGARLLLPQCTGRYDVMMIFVQPAPTPCLLPKPLDWSSCLLWSGLVWSGLVGGNYLWVQQCVGCLARCLALHQCLVLALSTPL
jgi:hypothetical protein